MALVSFTRTVGGHSALSLSPAGTVKRYVRYVPLQQQPSIECLQYGLIGSTEWGEDFADWIQDHVVAYLNLGKHLPSSVPSFR